MRAFLFFLWTGFASAQSDPAGLSLLRAVADNFRNLTAYSVERRFSVDSNSLLGAFGGLSFRIAGEPTRHLRFEIRGGEEWLTGVPFVAICDRSTGWVYYEKVKRYQKAAPIDWTRGYCSPGTLSDFQSVTENVRSATIVGTSQVPFEGKTEPCTVVEAQYRIIENLTISPAVTARVGRVSRTMCISESRKLILTDRLEADLEGGPHPSHIVESVTYDRIERNLTLSSALFEFQPPDGASEIERPKESATPFVSQPLPGVIYFNPPEPISFEQPAYSQEAWDEGLQGKVVLQVDVGAEGDIRKVTVRDSLGWGLDEKAIETVRKGRFTPATSAGQPVDGTALVAFTFSLPEKRPDLPSPGPVARPKPSRFLPSTDLKLPTELDNFFNTVATYFKSPAACARIDAVAEGRGGSNPGFEVETLQSECYFHLAAELDDARLCDHVTPVRVRTLDGSGYDRDYCLSQLGSKGFREPPSDVEGFARMTQKLGYEDAQITQRLARRQPFRRPGAINPDDYLEFVEDLALYGSEQNRAEFVKRAMSVQ